MVRYENFLHRGENRNKRCICGSGLKAKKCHGSDRFITAETRDELMKMHRLYQVNMMNMQIRENIEKLGE